MGMVILAFTKDGIALKLVTLWVIKWAVTEGYQWEKVQ